MFHVKMSVINFLGRIVFTLLLSVTLSIYNYGY